jgi:hypothetical protein
MPGLGRASRAYFIIQRPVDALAQTFAHENPLINGDMHLDVGAAHS